MKVYVTIAPLALCAAAAMAQAGKTGQTPVQNSSQTVNRGRLGTRQPLPPGSLTLSGILVDGGCNNRSSLNFRQPPIPVAAAAPAGMPAESAAGRPGAPANSAAAAAKGITIDAQTLEAERSDVMPHQAPEMRSRQQDPTCAITAATHGFALLLDNGRLLNLDEGGNTLAAQAIQSSTAGRAMLNGMGPGVKPRVTVTGRPQGDHLIVENLDID